MTNIDPVQVQNLIDQRLTKAHKDFLTIRQVFKGTTIFKAIGLKVGATQEDILSNVEPHLGQRFRLYRKAGKKPTVYLVRGQDYADLVLAEVGAQPGSKTFAQWAACLPISEADLMVTVNTMFETGKLSVRFKNKNSTYLFPGYVDTKPTIASIADTTPVADITPVADTTHAVTAEESTAAPPMPTEDQDAFQVAYNKVKGKHSTVRIFKIREQLGWTKERFDLTLSDLRVAYKIDLHMSDPSSLSSTEVENSYTDSHGMLYTGLSWRD